MFKRILLPLDLSDRHQAARKTACELAGQCDGEVELFHVIEKLSGLEENEEGEFYQRLRAKAEKHLEKQGSFFDEAKIRWRAEVRLGQRGTEVVKHAAHCDADLIILTAPRLDPASPEGWGSLSYKISILSQCPVLLVK